MFFHSLLTKPETELAKQVLTAQILLPIKDDWIHLVRKDLEFYDIDLSDSDISKMKKERFKLIIMKNIREEARKFLVNQKEAHSKSKGLAKNLKLQPYLQSKNLTLAEKNPTLNT